MWLTLKIFCWTVSPFLILGYGLAGFRWVARLVELPQSRLVLLACFSGFLLQFVLRKPLRFFNVLEHEMTHVFASLMFFRKPRALVVNDSGGAVQLEGEQANFIVTLAPYLLPTLALIWLPVHATLKPELLTASSAILAFLTGYCLGQNYDEFWYGQPDIQRSGKGLSTLLFILANVFFSGFLLSIATDGFGAAWQFCNQGWSHGIEFGGHLARIATSFYASI